MENIELFLSIAATGLGLLITTLTFLTKFIQSAKAKKIAENALKIGNAVLPYIEQAEKFLNYSGEEKKEFVMTKANQFAIENKIKFDAVSVSQKIEELIGLTRQVNKGKSPALDLSNTKNCGLREQGATHPIKKVSR